MFLFGIRTLQPSISSEGHGVFYGCHKHKGNYSPPGGDPPSNYGIKPRHIAVMGIGHGAVCCATMGFSLTE